MTLKDFTPSKNSVLKILVFEAVRYAGIYSKTQDTLFVIGCYIYLDYRTITQPIYYVTL